MKLSLRAWPVALILALSACGGPARTADPLEQAAAEATALVQSARATALLQRAHAEATALLSGAGALPAPGATARPLASTPPPAITLAPDPFPTEPAPAPTAALTGTQTVEVISVGYAAEGGFLIINFLAPPRVAARWYQGSVSLTDEATGAVYDEIPVMPVVGPLFGRPVVDGQPGYVMLVNGPQPLLPGALVTVELGEYRFEHVPVQ